MNDYGRWIILFCVLIMTLGQILFKQVAINYNKLGSLFDIQVIGFLIVAGLLYLTSSGLWVWALRYVEISKAYPYFALGFVFVPLFGAWLFGEVLTVRYGIGVLLIIAGVVLTSTS
jgi:drug/metabolite transporter (DMT)-like permease